MAFRCTKTVLRYGATDRHCDLFCAMKSVLALQKQHVVKLARFFHRAFVLAGDRPVDIKGNAMKSVLKVSLAALTLAFAVSSQAADK